MQFHLIFLRSLTTALLLSPALSLLPIPYTLLSAQAQTAQTCSAEAERLLEESFKLRSQGQSHLAVEKLQQALTICNQAGDRSRQVDILVELGDNYSFLGNRAATFKMMSQALTLAQTIGDRAKEAAVLARTGWFYYYIILDRQKGIDCYDKALNIYRSIGDTSGQIWVLGQLGSAYFILGQNQKSLDYFKQSIETARKENNQSGEAYGLLYISQPYAALGQKQKSLNALFQSRKLFQVMGSRAEEARVLRHLGGTYWDFGNSQQALDSSLESLAIYRSLGDRWEDGYVTLEIARFYQGIGNITKALEFMNQSLTSRRAVGERTEEARVLYEMGGLLEKQSQTELAIFFYKQSTNIIEETRQNQRELPKNEQEIYTKEIAYTYRTLADLLLKGNRVLEAQQVLDLLKVQELDDYLQNVRGTKDQRVDFLRPEQEILTKYNELQKNAIEIGSELADLRKLDSKNALSSTQQQRLAQLVKLETEINTQFVAFVDNPEIKRLTAKLQQSTDNENVNLAELRKLKDKLERLDAILLYPLILKDRLELVLSVPGSPPLRRTVKVTRQELNETILAFRTALGSRQDNARELAQKLYNWLIKPLEADLKASQPQTLIYAPDAQLRYIPLAALHDGNQWLTQRYAINHITAQSLTDLTATPSKAPKILAGAIGNRPVSIALDGDNFRFNGLPYTDNEVKSIQTLYPSTRILDGDSFSLPNVRPKLGDYNILHLATHASLVPKKVENSFILFGSSTYATLRDIESWSLNNFDLVILSACETGLGGNFGTGGEEILGLGYQFQTRGAKATIASLWQVNDGSTSKLMEQFYTNLSKGKLGKAAALRQAQITLIQGNGTGTGNDRSSFKIEVIQDGKTSTITRNLSHPFYWAPFILIGNGL